MYIKIILIFGIAFISVYGFTVKGRKCQLQEQYCDIMDPTKQCCPGTSCGVRRIDGHVSNLCVVCRDLGQPCNATKLCCQQLKCQKITEYASVCNPKTHISPFEIKKPDELNQNDENKYDYS